MSLSVFLEPFVERPLDDEGLGGVDYLVKAIRRKIFVENCRTLGNIMKAHEDHHGDDREYSNEQACS